MALLSWSPSLMTTTKVFFQFFSPLFVIFFEIFISFTLMVVISFI
jgi:hypothetical protein